MGDLYMHDEELTNRMARVLGRAKAMIVPSEDGGYIVDPHIFWGYPEDPDDHAAIWSETFDLAFENAIDYAESMERD